MARYKSGINGPFYGKVGSVIGSRWKSIDYIKGIPSPSDKPPSPKQLAYRARFAFINEWFHPIKPFINVGFMNYSDRMTAQNGAHSVNYPAVTGDYPDFQMDHTRVLVSHGDLPGVADPLLATQPGGQVELSWQVLDDLHEKPSDQMLLLMYSPELKIFDARMGYACRMDLGYAFKPNDAFTGNPTLFYLGFATPDRSRISTSQYLGEVLLE